MCYILHFVPYYVFDLFAFNAHAFLLDGLVFAKIRWMKGLDICIVLINSISPCFVRVLYGLNLYT